MKSVDISSLVRQNIRILKPYSSARDEFQGPASVYLDANENPNKTAYNRYPDPHQVHLKKRIAQLKKVQPEQIFLGNGSDEPIDLIIRAFCEPNRDNVVIPMPTYGMYSISASINAIAVKAVNLTSDFDIDLNAVEDAWDKNTKLLFMCSPNNPSGNLLSADKIKHLLETFKGVIILDEAYIDFIEGDGFLPLLGTHSNLVVLQTLSKAWGLAGIRLGMCFSNPEIIRLLNTIKPPYNISGLSQSVALACLENENKKNEWVREIKKQRQILNDHLTRVPQVEKVYPSDANFLLVKVKNAHRTYHDLVTRGIIVRDRSNVILCENCLRITVGTEQENKQLVDALRQL